MKLHRLRIKGNPRGGTIELDGIDIKGVTSAEVSLAAGQFPTLRIELITDDLELETDESLLAEEMDSLTSEAAEWIANKIVAKMSRSKQ